MEGYITDCIVDVECKSDSICEHRRCVKMAHGTPCPYLSRNFDMDMEYGNNYSSHSYYSKYNSKSCPKPYRCHKELGRCLPKDVYAKAWCESEYDCDILHHCNLSTKACVLKRQAGETCTSTSECFRNHYCYKGTCVAPCRINEHCYDKKHVCREIYYKYEVTQIDLQSSYTRSTLAGFCVEGQRSSRAGFYVGVILGPVLLLLVLLVLAFYLRKKHLHRFQAILDARASCDASSAPAAATAFKNDVPREAAAPVSSSASASLRADHSTVPPYELSTPKTNQDLTLKK